MKNNYSISETFKTIYSLIMTKITYPKARLIRRPFYYRGKRNQLYAPKLTTGYNCRFDIDKVSGSIEFGKNCEIGDNVHIVSHGRLKIGDNFLCASKVFISDVSHGEYKNDNQSSPNEIPKDRKLIVNEISIGNNVWVGENVVILSGVKLGNGVVIGANSVVTKSIADNTIAVGCPAKIIKQFNFSSNKWEMPI